MLILIPPLVLFIFNYIVIGLILFVVYIFIDFPKFINDFLSDYFGIIVFIISLIVTYNNLITISNLMIKIKEIIF